MNKWITLFSVGLFVWCCILTRWVLSLRRAIHIDHAKRIMWFGWHDSPALFSLGSKKEMTPTPPMDNS